MQHRVGALSDLPQLDIGELGFATDQNRLFIGEDFANVVGKSNAITANAGNGSDIYNTEIFTNSPNCLISFTQLTGTLTLATGNLKITGGSQVAGQVLQTDGAGNLNWVTVSGVGAGQPGGSNTFIQYNKSGGFLGTANFTYNDTSNTLTVDNIIGHGSIGTTGNVSASKFLGNGALLTNITGANVTGTVANANIANTVVASSQPNITSIGTLSNLHVTGNVTSGANLTVANALSANNISSYGTGGNGFVVGNGAQNQSALAFVPTAGVSANMAIRDFSTVPSNMYFDVSVGANANGQFIFRTGNGFHTYATLSNSGTTLSNGLIVTGNISSSSNITGNLIIGNGSSLTSITGANVTGWVGNANIANTVVASSQPNITSVGTLVSLNVTGNVQANKFLGDGGFLGNINAGNVIGNIQRANIANLASSATTVIAPNQPNITSVGPLANLSVLGNIASNGFFVGNGSLLTGTLPSRSNISVVTANIANGASASVTAQGYKGYALYSLQTTAPAWVTIYTSIAAQTADANRPITSDPLPGSGVITEVITANTNPIIFAPALMGFSSENVPDGNIQMKINNQSGAHQPITVTITVLPLED